VLRNPRAVASGGSTTCHSQRGRLRVECVGCYESLCKSTSEYFDWDHSSWLSCRLGFYRSACDISDDQRFVHPSIWPTWLTKISQGEIHTEWRILIEHETDSLAKLMSIDKFYNSQHGRTNEWELLHINVCAGAWPDTTTTVDNQTSMAEFSGIPRSPANADDGLNLDNFYKLKLAIKNLANENYQSTWWWYDKNIM